MSSGRALGGGLGVVLLLSCAQGEAPVATTNDSRGDEEVSTPALTPWHRLDLPPEIEATISWEEARDWVGKVVAVEGAIVRTHNSGKACFLGFGPYEEKTFTAVIFASSFGDYSAPPETLFADRRIRVSGRVKLYRDIPEIVIENPSQLVLLGS
mgnify:CR=1 FL=1